MATLSSRRPPHSDGMRFAQIEVAIAALGTELAHGLAAEQPSEKNNGDTMIRSIRSQLIFKWIAALSLTVAGAVHAEEGVTDTTILIGQTVGITGQVAGSVKELNEGANAYFTQINQRGGVNGRRIELLTLDDRFEPATAAANALMLVKQKHVFSLFLSRGTPHTEAMLPVLAANNVPLVAPSTGAAVFHTPINPLVFPVRAKYQDEVSRTVQHFNTVGLREIGLIYVDDSFGRDALIGFKQAMSELKLAPAMTISFDRKAPDLQAVLATVKATPAAALIIAGSASTTAELIKAIRQQGGKMTLTTLSNNASTAFITSLGSAASGVIVSQITPAPDLSTTILGQEFKVAAANSKATVSYTAMEGFLAAKVLVEGIRRAGKNLTREGLIAALESMRKVDFGGVSVNYDREHHSGSEFVELTMVGRDGRFVR